MLTQFTDAYMQHSLGDQHGDRDHIDPNTRAYLALSRIDAAVGRHLDQTRSFPIL